MIYFSFKLKDEECNLSKDDYDTVNKLAAIIYKCRGYKSREGFDFAKSVHPMEQEMFITGYRVLEFHKDVGLD